ncbi:aminotransferase class III-fold pyridoxal phosphate-dependent enzyme [Luedemannella flava]
MDRADGAYLTDRDGNTYIDFLQAGGPTILGSNYAPVNERVAEVIKASGPVTGLFHEYELKLAEIINRYLPHVEMYRSLGSGTEAVMAAVRGRERSPVGRWSSRSAGRTTAGPTPWSTACACPAASG